MRILLSAIYPYAFLLLYLTIPFDNYIRALPNILLGILMIAFPFVVKKEDLRKLKSLPIIIFLGFFAFLCIISFLSGRFPEDYVIIKKVMIALGLAILYIPVADFDQSNGRVGKINSAIIFSALAAILFSIYNFVLITDASGSFAIGDSPQVVESLLIDRLYLGLLSTFSILISFQAIQKTYHPNNNYYLANIFINFIFIVLIASKIAVISLFILLLIHQFYGKRKLWKWLIAVGAIVMVVGLFFLLKNEKDNTLYNSGNVNAKVTPAFIENSMTYELRAVVWQCATDIIKEESLNLIGIGFAKTKNKLISCYESKITNPEKSKEFVTERYNTHSQFLDFYISAGIIALLLFLIFILVSFILTRKQFFPTAMVCILVIYCLVENVFHRQIGAYYVGFILIAIMTTNKCTENNKTKIE